MSVTEEGKKGLRSGSEVGDVPADAAPSGPTTEPKRREELARQHEELLRREQERQAEARRQAEQPPQ